LLHARAAAGAPPPGAARLFLERRVGAQHCFETTLGGALMLFAAPALQISGMA